MSELLKMSAGAVPLILMAVVIRALAMNRLPKWTFLVLWAVAVARLLVPVSVPSPVSVYTLANRLLPREAPIAQYVPAPVQTSAVWPSVVRPTAAPIAASANAATALASQTTVVALPTPIAMATTAPEALPTPVPPLPTETILMIIWGAGALACAALFVGTHLRCRREYAASLPVTHEAVTAWLRGEDFRRNPSMAPDSSNQRRLRARRFVRRVRVRQSDRVAAPLTYGVFAPVILLPKTMDFTDIAQLQCVLAHEATHIRRFDVLGRWLLAAAVCAHWFNPLAWVLYILAGRDIELSCDEAVVRSSGETLKSAYAMALLRMEEKRLAPSPLSSHFARQAMEERIQAIMKIKKPSLWGIALALVIVLATTSVFATSAAPWTPAAPALSPEAPVAAQEADATAKLASRKAQFAAYQPLGITYHDADDRLYYDGQRIGRFYDAEANLRYAVPEGGLLLTAVYEGGKLANIQTISSIKADALHREIGEALDRAAGVNVSTTNAVSAAIGSAASLPAETYARYAAYGVTYDAALDRLYLNGELIRVFEDTYPIDGNTAGADHYSASGTVDVRTVRDLSSPVRNADGSYDPSGVLTGVEAVRGAAFEVRDIAPWATRPAVTGVASTSPIPSPDKLSAETYAQYAAHGITYDEAEDKLYLNGELIRVFEDITPTVQDDTTMEFKAIAMMEHYTQGGTVDVRAVRDRSMPVFNADGSRSHSVALAGVETLRGAEFEARDISRWTALPAETHVASSGPAPTPDELAAAYAQYEPFGVTYDKSTDRMYFDGQPVRRFMDVLTSNGESLDSGKFSGAMTMRTFDGGEIDIITVRDHAVPDENGYGKLISVELMPEEVYSYTTEDIARILEDIAPYKPYGLTFDAESGMFLFGGAPVRELNDAVTGELITNSLGTDFPANTIDVVPEYTSGMLVGLREATQEEFDQRTAEREAYLRENTLGSAQVFDSMVSYPAYDAGLSVPDVTGLAANEAAALLSQNDLSYTAGDPAQDAGWFTADEYAAWLEQEKQGLASVIGSWAWTNYEGWFVWTQERVDEAIARYERTLEEIRGGMLLEKTVYGQPGSLAGWMDADAEAAMNAEAAAEDAAPAMEGPQPVAAEAVSGVTAVSGTDAAPIADMAQAGAVSPAPTYLHVSADSALPAATPVPALSTTVGGTAAAPAVGAAPQADTGVLPPELYTKSAWALSETDYIDLLNSISLRTEAAQVYLCKGTIAEIITTDPPMAIMNTGTDEKPRYVLLENQSYNTERSQTERAVWTLGKVYKVYAEASGEYDGMPQLVARYTYDVLAEEGGTLALPSTPLWYNPDGGSFYHIRQDCQTIHEKYQGGLKSFPFAEIGEDVYAKLSPCPTCGAPDASAGVAVSKTGELAVVNLPNPEDRLILRSMPDANAGVAGRYYSGVTVSVQPGHESDAWAFVYIGNTGGFMLKEYLAFGDDAAGVTSAIPFMYVAGRETTLFNSPEQDVPTGGTFPMDTEVEVLGEADGWLHVRVGETYGYLSVNELRQGE